MHLLDTLGEGIVTRVILARVLLATQSRHSTTLVNNSALVQEHVPNPLVTDPEDTVF